MSKEEIISEEVDIEIAAIKEIKEEIKEETKEEYTDKNMSMSEEELEQDKQLQEDLGWTEE